MAISPVDSDVSVEEPFRPEPTNWELTGKVSLFAFSLLAIASLGFACCKKKRIYSYISDSPQVAPHPIEIAAAEPLPPPRPAAPVSLSQCTEKEEETVVYIFNAIADWSYTALLSDKLSDKEDRLEKRGETIKHLHPFALLMAIPKPAMKKIFASPWLNSFQISNVMNGIVSGMKREKNNLTPHIPILAAKMGKDPERIASLTRSQEKWPALVDYLFDI